MAKSHKTPQQRILFSKIFHPLNDPRRVNQGNHRHKLSDIIFLVISAVISGASDWDQIEVFGKSQIQWLRKFYPFKNGIPSHDTINRVISAIEPKLFNECFVKWINEISHLSKGEVVAIDGKRLCGSYDKSSGKSAIHIVSAYASENKLCLGQISTNEKSNEITAIPELLNSLAIKGCTITIDAMGCQTKIAEEIIKKQADYLLAVKGNQSSLEQGIQDTIRFTKPIEEDSEVDIGHGRIETRVCKLYQVTDHIEEPERWKDFKTIVEIKTERTIKSTGEVNNMTRYYITNLAKDAKKINHAIRSHWSIENNLHWELDVTFGEDASRKRMKNAAENFNIISKIALSLLNTEKSVKASKKNKRLLAALNPDFRQKVLKI